MRTFRIPGAQPQIDQGATKQQTFPVPPVTALERAGWIAREYNRYIVPAPPQIHQGATVQPTFPVPPVSQPELSYLRLQQNRYIVDAPKQQDQGATIQVTHPVPPVSQPEYRYYRPDINRAWDWVGPDQQFDGPTVQQTHPTPPVSEPEFSWWRRNDVYRPWTLGPQPQFAGATVLATHPVPPASQPELSRWRALDVQRPWLLGPTPQFDGATVRDANGFQFLTLIVARGHRIVKTPFNLHDVPASNIPTILSEPTAQWEYLRQAARNNPDIVKRFEGATVQDTIPTPTVTGPELSWWKRADIFRPWVLGPTSQFDGAAIQATFPVPPVSGPEFSWWRRTDIFRPWTLGPTAQFQGATVLDTSPIPPVSGPDRAWWYRTDINRAWIWEGPEQMLDGPTIQQQFIFPPNQPDLSRFPSRLQIELARRLEGAVTDTGSYIFPTSEPEFRAYLLALNARLSMTGPAQQYAGALTQQTFPVPSVDQPEVGAYLLLHSPRYRTAVSQELAQPPPPAFLIPVILSQPQGQVDGTYRALLAVPRPQFEGGGTIAFALAAIAELGGRESTFGPNLGGKASDL